MTRSYGLWAWVCAVALVAVPADSDTSDDERTLTVVATAYNSIESQTDADPTIAAWGDSLSPGMKAIAVSRDLIELGLSRGRPVSIEGLPGEYRVLDKMNRRWNRRSQWRPRTAPLARRLCSSANETHRRRPTARPRRVKLAGLTGTTLWRVMLSAT